ncbi:nuclear transport factor 2 family protein [Oceanibium sediminis]|uniref:nuclear transport factor 2 family protein n=1 Tax=Oceanibium sediminis TaxID=2026339 RepID=UPI000DD4A5DA|nr:SnoaL-like domain-containing protein [Oceanibium sediminis]
MSVDTLKTVASTLVDYCRTGQEAKGLSELYALDATSTEAGPGPDGGDPLSNGVDAIRGKHAWWAENFEVHSITVDGPYLHGDKSFAVIFEIDATHTASGQRQAMKEVALYTLNDAGKIIAEAFFMSAG